MRSRAGVEMRVADRTDAVDDVERARDQQQDPHEYDTSSTSHYGLLSRVRPLPAAPPRRSDPSVHADLGIRATTVTVAPDGGPHPDGVVAEPAAPSPPAPPGAEVESAMVVR